MRRIIFLLLFGALIIALPCAVTAAPVFRLTGHVYGGTGTSNPLTGANVAIGPTPVNVTTDSSGAYLLSSPPTGSVQITASALGYVTQTVTKTIPSGTNVVQDFNLIRGLPISVPMDHQINVGLGNAITGPGALSFQPAGGVEPDGWCKNPIPGGVDGPRLDFAKAGIASIDISDPNTAMDVDVRIYHEHEYGDAGMCLLLRDTGNRWRNYGYGNGPDGGLNSYLHDNNWSHRTYLLNDYARQAWDLGASDPNFDPTHVNYMTWTATDWQNSGNDWTGVKKIVFHILPPPPSISSIKALPLHSTVQLFAMPVSYTPTIAGLARGNYFYIQQADRAAGIRAVNLTSSAIPASKGCATFTATLEADATTQEPYLAITSLSASGTGSMKPIGVNTKSINEDAKLAGMLVRTSGTIRTIDTVAFQWFTIADGYAKDNAEVTTKVVVATPAGDPVIENKIVVGDSVKLTGVVSQTGPDTREILLKSFVVDAGPTPPPHTKLKAIVVNCNPHCPAYGNQRTNQVFGWADPHNSCQTYIDDLRDASAGYADYEVVDWIDCEYHTTDTNGFAWGADAYIAAWQNGTAGQYVGMDYPKFLTDKSYPHNNPLSLAERVAAGQCDEILLFGAPSADGQWEAAMAGPSPFFVNGGSYYVSSTGRNVVVMGFNYERGVGEMLEDYCHRTECVMSRVFHPSNWWFPTWPVTNNWDRFRMKDSTHPGDSACGFCHFAPNSAGDYDWGNTTWVESTCDDWVYNWPNLQGASTKRLVNATDWGNGDMRGHHVWWLRHLPKRDGVNPDGKQNNWWKYTATYWAYPESW